VKRANGFLTGVVVGAIGMYGAMTYHVVRAPDGWHFVPKFSPSLSQTYVDIREFEARDWNEHRNLAVALVKADKEHLIGSSSLTGLQDAAREAIDSLGL
jgi:hypothetical protein